MATETITRCDKCLQRCSEKSRVRIPVFVDRKMDAAGSLDDVTEVLDLCAPCVGRELEHGLQALTYEQRANWVRRIRRIGESARKVKRG